MRAFDFREICISSESEIQSIKDDELITEELPVELDTAPEQKYFPCPICQSLFSSSQELAIHVVNRHPVTEDKHEEMPRKSSNSGKKFECHICSKKFESPWKVKRHLLVHRDVIAPAEMPKFPPRKYKHECPECGKRVETPSKLQRHMSVHDKKTRMSSGVNQHRPLACEDCPMR